MYINSVTRIYNNMPARKHLRSEERRSVEIENQILRAEALLESVRLADKNSSFRDIDQLKEKGGEIREILASLSSQASNLRTVGQSEKAQSLNSTIINLWARCEWIPK